MTTQKSLHKINQTLWVYWFLFTLLAIVFVLVNFIVWVGPLISSASPLFFGSVLGMCFGLTTGLAQWIVLKRYLTNSYLWIVSTMLAWTLFFALNMAGFFGRGEDLSSKMFEGSTHGFLFGALLGFVQWLAIGRFSARSAAWIWINALVWSLCAMVADGFKMAFHLYGPAEFMIAFALASFLSGIGMNKLIPAFLKVNR